MLLSDLQGRNVYAYLDDLIIYNRDPESHFKTLEEVLLRLKNAGLKAKLTKCEFLKERISFLGHQVDDAGIHTMDDKSKAVQNYPQHQSADKVRSFLGLCGYYTSFVKGFSTIASPLTKLLRKEYPSIGMLLKKGVFKSSKGLSPMHLFWHFQITVLHLFCTQMPLPLALVLFLCNPMTAERTVRLLTRVGR